MGAYAPCKVEQACKERQGTWWFNPIRRLRHGPLRECLVTEPIASFIIRGRHNSKNAAALWMFVIRGVRRRQSTRHRVYFGVGGVATKLKPNAKRGGFDSHTPHKALGLKKRNPTVAAYTKCANRVGKRCGKGLPVPLARGSQSARSDPKAVVRPGWRNGGAPEFAKASGGYRFESLSRPRTTSPS